MKIKDIRNHLNEIVDMDYVTDDQKAAIEASQDLISRLAICNLCEIHLISRLALCNLCEICVVAPDDVKVTECAEEQAPARETGLMPDGLIVILGGKTR